ncbi:hypothetical protein [Streptomyces sp. NPDC058291]|uniref:hypothetical protein n=1 Tax=Streptomyces sp. NPDC058291 TaxID=3346427 RepID=UPI0036E8EA82
METFVTVAALMAMIALGVLIIHLAHRRGGGSFPTPTTRTVPGPTTKAVPGPTTKAVPDRPRGDATQDGGPGGSP